MFRPSRSSSGLPRKQIQEFFLVSLRCGIPYANKFQLQKQNYMGLYKLNLLCDSFNTQQVQFVQP